MIALDKIFLIGPMGAGKTTVGRQLARRLCLPFVDADLELESRTGVSVSLIFELEGEAGFRAREARLIDELSRWPQIVLATGGGAVLDPQTRRILRERGVVLYLQTTVEDQLVRLRHDRRRPLLMTPDRAQRLRALAAERGPLYEQCAHLSVHSDLIRSSRLADRAIDALATHVELLETAS